MNTPPMLAKWLSHRVESFAWASVVEPRQVEHKWRRATGGRVLRAELTAAIEPSAEFELEIDAPHLTSEYRAAAQSGVITVLLSQGHLPVLACKVRLLRFGALHDDSCYAGFYAVSEEATKLLLGVAPGSVHNIRWGHGA